jgi:hypothetical protein
MRQQMRFQFAEQSKLLRTMWTREGGVARVHFRMLFQGLAGRKGLVTFQTGVGDLVCVSQHVLV